MNLGFRQKLNKWPLMIALIVLTVLSSCTLRKGLLAHFDVSVGRQLNPSKTVLPGGTVCITDDVLQVAQTEAQFFAFSVAFIPEIVRLSLLETKAAQPFQRRESLAVPDKIPFYILYQKLKIQL